MDSIFLKSFMPEIFLSLSILFQLVFNSIIITKWKYNFPIISAEIFIQTGFILFCVFSLLLNVKIEGYFNTFLFLNNQGTNLIKIVLIFFSFCTLILLIKGFQIQKLNLFEFFTIFLLSIFSLLLLISSYDFLSVYLLLEAQSLCFYILASFLRNSAFSTEAGLKYFISGSFISGLFLFGCTLIYGSLGTLNFQNINLLLAIPLDSSFYYLHLAILLGFFLILITLLFKLTVAPFHFWVPDVYEGSPLSTTIIFSILPKIVIFHLLLKCIKTFSLIIYEFQGFLIITGLLSLFLGIFFAIKQKRLKRLIIFSSISQIGFLILVLATNTFEGLIASIFYLIIYLISSLLIWSYVIFFYYSQNKINIFEKKQNSTIFLANLLNFFKIDKLSSFSFILIFFSIAGIPPLAGFLSKFFILEVLINNNFLLITILIIIISSISAFYYLRIIKIIFFEKKKINSIKHYYLQTLFFNSFSDLYYCIIVLNLYCLIFFFIFPDFLLLNIQFILLNFFLI
jgi:NADH-quinone oxidoreductase subunit N